MNCAPTWVKADLSDAAANTTIDPEDDDDFEPHAASPTSKAANRVAVTRPVRIRRMGEP